MAGAADPEPLLSPVTIFFFFCFMQLTFSNAKKPFFKIRKQGFGLKRAKWNSNMTRNDGSMCKLYWLQPLFSCYFFFPFTFFFQCVENHLTVSLTIAVFGSSRLASLAFKLRELYGWSLLPVPGNCAHFHKGGWWYNACGQTNLNGVWYTGGVYRSKFQDGIFWADYGGGFYSMKSVRMLIRPIDWDGTPLGPGTAVGAKLEPRS